jgi:predicted nucleotidyltransferase
MNKKNPLTENETKALQELKDTLSKRFALLDFRLYGSKARGDSEPDSDMDVMLLLEQSTPEIRAYIYDTIYELILKYDTLISPVLYVREDIENGPLSESPLYKIILKEGIPL